MVWYSPRGYIATASYVNDLDKMFLKYIPLVVTHLFRPKLSIYGTRHSIADMVIISANRAGSKKPLRG